MTERVRQPDVRDAVTAAIGDEAGAERYRRRLREVRSGTAHASERARPLEFDESGFPLPQRSPGFVERVARLVNPL